MKLLVTFTFWLSCVAAAVINSAAGVGAEAHDIASSEALAKQHHGVAKPTFDTVMDSVQTAEKDTDIKEKGIFSVDGKDTINEETAFALYNLTLTEDQKVVKRADILNATKTSGELTRRDPVDDYNRDHPFNQIPDWVYCYHPTMFPVSPTRYERGHILATLEAARRLRDEDIFNRPGFNGIRYPHIIGWTEAYSQTETHVRRLNLGHIQGDPFMFPILSKLCLSYVIFLL